MLHKILLRFQEKNLVEENATPRQYSDPTLPNDIQYCSLSIVLTTVNFSNHTQWIMLNTVLNNLLI